MTKIEKELHARSGSKCELCGANENLIAYSVPPVEKESVDKSVLICENCYEQIENPEKIDANHWRCLNDSMWNENAAVQVMAWRMLNRLKKETWPQDLLDMLYLDQDTLAWANATGEHIDEDETSVKHHDSNGVEILAGDSVTIIKDLNVKGTSFVAKRGTTVRNISLVHDNPEQIEGKVNGQTIVILTQFVKK